MTAELVKPTRTVTKPATTAETERSRRNDMGSQSRYFWFVLPAAGREVGNANRKMPQFAAANSRHLCDFHLCGIALQDVTDLGQLLDLLAELKLLLLELANALLKRGDIARYFAQVFELALKQFLVLLQLQGQGHQGRADPRVQVQA